MILQMKSSYLSLKLKSEKSNIATHVHLNYTNTKDNITGIVFLIIINILNIVMIVYLE